MVLLAAIIVPIIGASLSWFGEQKPSDTPQPPAMKWNSVINSTKVGDCINTLTNDLTKSNDVESSIVPCDAPNAFIIVTGKDTDKQKCSDTLPNDSYNQGGTCFRTVLQNGYCIAAIQKANTIEISSSIMMDCKSSSSKKYPLKIKIIKTGVQIDSNKPKICPEKSIIFSQNYDISKYICGVKVP